MNVQVENWWKIKPLYDLQYSNFYGTIVLYLIITLPKSLSLQRGKGIFCIYLNISSQASGFTALASSEGQTHDFCFFFFFVNPNNSADLNCFRI